MWTRLLLVATLATSLVARADEPTPAQKATAKRLYERAIIHYRSGDLDKAVVEFKDSFEAYPRPETLFNLAQTHRLLENHDKAIFFYKQYLSMADASPSDRQLAEQRIAEQQKLIAQQRASETPAPAPAPAPKPVVAPEPSASPQLTLTRTPAARARDQQPVYKKWWLWTIVGVAVVGAGVGLGVGLTQANSSSTNIPGVQF
jgi:tetratricopeptide (TPR) repeat protein